MSIKTQQNTYMQTKKTIVPILFTLATFIISSISSNTLSLVQLQAQNCIYEVLDGAPMAVAKQPWYFCTNTSLAADITVTQTIPPSKNITPDYIYVVTKPSDKTITGTTPNGAFDFNKGPGNKPYPDGVYPLTVFAYSQAGFNEMANKFKGVFESFGLDISKLPEQNPIALAIALDADKKLTLAEFETFWCETLPTMGAIPCQYSMGLYHEITVTKDAAKCQAIGIDSNAASNKFVAHILPGNTLQFTLPDAFNTANIIIYTANGHLFESLPVSYGTFSKSVSTKTWPKGIYLAKITNNNGYSFNTRFAIW